MLEELKKAQNKVIGTKQVLKAVKAESIEKVYVAEDADSFIKTKLLDEIEKAGLCAVMVPTMKELGESCGIQVKSAVAGILK